MTQDESQDGTPAAGSPMPARGDFSVLGFSLPAEQVATLHAAFPGKGPYALHAATYEAMNAACAKLGKVVVFSYMPHLRHRTTRLSAVFTQDEVKVIGFEPDCTLAALDLAMQREFAGLLPAGADAATCRAAALAVFRGELWFPRSYLSERLRASLFESAPDSLSTRELDILRLLAADVTNDAIAQRLFVSRDTVRWHLRSIYAKLGISNRAAALRFARNKLRYFPVAGTANEAAAGNHETI